MLTECFSVTILLVTAVKSVIGCVRRNPHIRLELARGIALEFKPGGEAPRTVIVREQTELITPRAVILLRGALTFLIHWEIKSEEARMGEAGGKGTGAGSGILRQRAAVSLSKSIRASFANVWKQLFRQELYAVIPVS